MAQVGCSGGEAQDVTKPSNSTHCCRTGGGRLLSLISDLLIDNVLILLDAFNPPEAVEAVDPGHLGVD